MPETSLQQTREEMARREVGQTNVGRGIAWVLVVQFLLVVAGVPASEIIHDLWNPQATDNPAPQSIALITHALRPRANNQ